MYVREPHHTKPLLPRPPSKGPLQVHYLIVRYSIAIASTGRLVSADVALWGGVLCPAILVWLLKTPFFLGAGLNLMPPHISQPPYTRARTEIPPDGRMISWCYPQIQPPIHPQSRSRGSRPCQSGSIDWNGANESLGRCKSVDLDIFFCVHRPLVAMLF